MNYKHWTHSENSGHPEAKGSNGNRMARSVPELKRSVLAGMVEYMDYVKAGNGDPGYTQDDVNRCERIIDAYLSSLTMAPDGGKEQFILAAVQAVILELNRLNDDCKGTIIETDQREDLCPLIELAAKEAGLASDSDITYQWRQW
jgi:hypothetical protein